MSDFFRRASDAFHHRQRQDSTDSTDVPKSPDLAKPPEQEPLNQKSESAQPGFHDNEAFAGTATDNVAHPKQRRHWGWGHHPGNKPETKQQPSQEQKDSTN
ncbi:uncharacterized protein N7506_000139 [Penicillium brevicompactum]|uniref:uncharacterized protein n=1 Tax=Penicillium brevicompactum TaxID=5074 RepID=UPI0025407A63|nr:uncharacterized protein N7506_000139 [Penicillium brevicompactum]KAJ5346886.1 hypothetical protein N7506_000139 [Penicillium brevicompactum]